MRARERFCCRLFLNADFFEGKLTKEEEAYRDADEQPSQGKYIVMLRDSTLQNREKASGESKLDFEGLVKQKENMAFFLTKLSKGETLTQQEIQEYCEWKKQFRGIILERFCETQKNAARRRMMLK